MTHTILTTASWLNLGSLVDLYSDIKRTLRQRADSRETYKALSVLSDRELKDIGLSRSDISSVANNTFWDDVVAPNNNLKGWV